MLAGGNKSSTKTGGMDILPEGHDLIEYVNCAGGFDI
jgi:hypothetical protein